MIDRTCQSGIVSGTGRDEGWREDRNKLSLVIN